MNFVRSDHDLNPHVSDAYILKHVRRKTETDCPACGTRVILSELVGEYNIRLYPDEGIPHMQHVWCAACWTGMTEDQKQEAVAAVLPVERKAMESERARHNPVEIG